MYQIINHRVNAVTPVEELPVRIGADEIQRLISLTSTEAIVDRRKSLLREFRGASCLHDPRENKVEKLSPSNNHYLPLIPQSILLIRLLHGFEARGRYFKSAVPNRRLVIFNTGHSGQTRRDTEVIGQLLERGFDVVGLDMPLTGDNNRPIVRIDRVGTVQFSTHDQLRLLESADFNPLVLFVEPIACLVNLFSNGGDYDQITQIGVSGGGFVATLIAALDTRITKTYAVAGAFTTFLRFANPTTSSGDYEQVNKSLLQQISDLDLYIMAADGKNREYVQSFNEFDPCCYAGRGFELYAAIVGAHVKNISAGQFDAWLDKTTFEHEISIATFSKIYESLTGQVVR